MSGKFETREMVLGKPLQSKHVQVSAKLYPLKNSGRQKDLIDSLLNPKRRLFEDLYGVISPPEKELLTEALMETNKRIEKYEVENGEGSAPEGMEGKSSDFLSVVESTLSPVMKRYAVFSSLTPKKTPSFADLGKEVVGATRTLCSPRTTITISTDVVNLGLVCDVLTEGDFDERFFVMHLRQEFAGGLWKVNTLSREIPLAEASDVEML